MTSEQYQRLWIKAFRAAGHKPILNEDGKVDYLAHSGPGHNGPECLVCGVGFCMHCTTPDNPRLAEPCEGPDRKAKAQRLYEDRILAEADEIRARRNT